MKKAAVCKGLAGIMAFLTVLSTTATTLTFQYDGNINSFLNVSNSKVVTVSDAEEVDTAYYSSEYGTDYNNADAALTLELDVAEKIIEQVEEGVVMVKNDNAVLPLAATTGITLFGSASSNSFTSGISSINGASVVSALQNAFGLENVNTTLVDNVYSSGGGMGGFGMPGGGGGASTSQSISDIKKYENTWASSCNDVAMVFLNRSAGEGSDQALDALSLTDDEEDLFAYLKEEKAAGTFKSIVAVISGDNQMEMGFLDEYDVDACLITGNVGTTGYIGVANILCGEANPSGKLTDTYAYSNLSAPATTYAAENIPSWSNTDYVNANCTDNDNNGLFIDSYLIYAEGIYVGYKYYETRYEDSVMGTGNAAGTAGSTDGNSWNYSNEVVYPFGYGLSYTAFTQEIDSVEFNAKNDSYDVTVTVTNTGSTAGKDVVEVYAQTPYGEYEKTNLVEKASVNLVGYGKTQMLDAGASETITVSVPRYFLASYDANNAKGYILSEGTYYFAIGNGAHDALNNILAAKGYTVADGMNADGDASLTYTWEQDSLDTQTYKNSIYTGEEVTNQFDHVDLNSFGYNFTYLTRQNWEGTYPVKQVILEATDEVIDGLNNTWYEDQYIPAQDEIPSVDDYQQGVDNGIQLIDMLYTEYEDDEAWDKFLDEFTVDELGLLMKDSTGSDAIDRLGVVSFKRADDGINGNALLSTGEKTLTWPSEPVTARSWNADLAYTRGYYRGLEASFCGVNELWYGCGNLDRTAYCGKSSNYYSEDGNLGYICSTNESNGCADAGVIFCIKHFALNDQETLRESYVTFANEQSLREIYFRVFEGACANGGGMGVMTALNRVGLYYAGASYQTTTQLLRNEWGFEGHVTTDGFAVAGYKTHYLETLTSGVDYLCFDANNYTGQAAAAAVKAGDGTALKLLRLAAKRNLYTIVHSVAVNGLSSNSMVVSIVPAWKTALFVADIVFILAFLGTAAASVVLTYKTSKKKNGEEKA